VAERASRSGPPSWLLWAAAFALTLGAAVYQRMTGPTHPLRGQTVVEGETMSWLLPRRGTAGEALRIDLPAPGDVLGATLRFRRYPTDDPFSGFTMLRDEDRLLGLLPAQPPAGKLEYYVVLATRSGLVRVPEDKPVVMRFRGTVPVAILVPHVTFILVAMLLGLRAGLEALYSRPHTRRLSRWTLIGITLGGMLLGPLVQKLAFDTFWTGWPFGEDMTDNKTLLAWVAWVLAVLVVRAARDPADRFARTMVVAAAVITFVVYMVPHSLGGSELDYEKLDAGVPPWEAVTTGR
jgi:hypothetical protein